MEGTTWIWDELEKLASRLDDPRLHYEISKIMIHAAKHGRMVNEQYMMKPAEMLLVRVNESQRQALKWAIKEASHLRDCGEKKRLLQQVLDSAVGAPVKSIAANHSEIPNSSALQ